MTWGYRHLVVLNIFALRSTDPRRLYDHPDPVGPDNERWFREVLPSCSQVVCAWGNHGRLHDQGKVAIGWIRDVGHVPRMLRITKVGQPQHPLYLPGDLVPVVYDQVYQTDPEYRRHKIAKVTMRYAKQGGAGYRKRVVIEALLDRDGFICTHCGEFLVDPYDGMQTHIDHIKPVAHGGGERAGQPSDDAQPVQQQQGSAQVRDKILLVQTSSSGGAVVNMQRKETNACGTGRISAPFP